jgi:hypothetical protein
MIVYGDPETWGMTVDQFLDSRRLERESFADGTNPKIKMILDMLRRGMDVDTISTITGATVEEINNIAKTAKPISTEELSTEEPLSKNKTYSEIDILSNIDAKNPGGITGEDVVINPMPNPVPRMDEYMPEAEGMEDLRYRQLELAEGGVVDYNRNPQGSNQYKTKTLEEIQQIIEANPDLTAKDLEGYGKETRGRLLTRDDLRRAKEAGIEPKISGKRIYKDRRERDIRRKEKIQPSQGQPISIKGSRTTGSNIEFGHVYPFSELAPQTTKMTGYIPADMNKKLTKFNNEAYKIVKQQEEVIKKDPNNKRKIMELNAKAKLNSENAVKTLGPKYKGLIGHFRINPDTLTLEKKGGDFQKSFAGISGEEIIYKDLSSKDRVAFEKKISDDLKNNPELVKQIQQAGFVCRKKAGGPIDIDCIAKDLVKQADKLQTGTELQQKSAFNKFKNIGLTAGKGALKILGPILTPLVAYDTFKSYKEGKPAFEILEEGLIGTGLARGIREAQTYTPEEREAIAQKKQYAREEQDYSGLSSDFNIPSNMSADQIDLLSVTGPKRVEEKLAAEDAARAAERVYEGDPGFISETGYDVEERTGFKKGSKDKDSPVVPISPLTDLPQNESRRDFLKGIGAVGLGAVALGSGLLKLGKSAEVSSKIASMIKNTTAPSWMEALVTKIIKKGTDISIPKQAGSATEKISIKELEFKNPETGKMEKVQLKIDETNDSVTVDYFGNNTVANQGVTLELVPKQKIVDKGNYLTSERVKDEYHFRALESEPRVSNFDGDIEFDSENYVNKIIDLRSDISGLKSYVTGGKGIDKTVAKQKKMVTEDIEKNPLDYIDDTYDPDGYLQ